MNIFRALTSLLIVASACAVHAIAYDPATVAKNLVRDAVTMFEQKGRDYTLRVVGNISGPFRKGSTHAFVMSMKGIVLAHPANKELVGKDVTTIKDWNGTLFFRDMVTVAREDKKGWVEYWWLRHGQQKPTLTRTYIEAVPNEDLFVAASYYAE